MFLETTLAYPLLLAVLCAGAGLLVDRLSGGWLPGSLLVAVGGAALIALSQLTTYLLPLAPATPYLILSLAVAGILLGRRRLAVLATRGRERGWQLGLPVLAYTLALAPVLFAGRPSFSSFMALSDSAVHMLGADYLVHHGQDYAHLDLRNSYGQFVNNYYNTGYPSGSDTLFGGTALLLGTSLIWAFQPFTAFMLATATGPAWLLARRIGLGGVWAALAALSATVPALVYGYELLGSIKEVTAISMILTMGVLAAEHRRWLTGAARGAVPFALAAAAGISALGIGFGAWALAASLVLLCALAGAALVGRASRRSMTRRASRRSITGRALRGPIAGLASRGPIAVLGFGMLVGLVAAWPTFSDLSGSLRVAHNIASTSNPGNLHAPLETTQVFGVWLRGSYKQLPSGFALDLTRALSALAGLACLAGVVQLLRTRELVLAMWATLTLLVWLIVSLAVTTWVQAKSEMLSSPVVLLLAWGGVAALRSLRPRSLRPGSHRLRWSRLGLASLPAIALAGGVLASDLLQYRTSNLAPTARYDELASLNTRFAGRGPTLFTDFDEYSLYVLRDLDVGGPDFAYPPAQLASLAGGYGNPVVLDRASPSALGAYPLIVTRRDPTSSPPPLAYRLIWQGAYYEVWARPRGTPPASAHVSGRLACPVIGRLAHVARARGLSLTAVASPEIVPVRLQHSSYPRAWGRQRGGLVMSRPGRLEARFQTPTAGTWEVWLQGQIMPPVGVSVDRRPLATVAGHLAGNSLVPDTIGPLRTWLSSGTHELTVARGGFSLAPGAGGSAVLDSIFLTPAGAPVRQGVALVPGVPFRALCDRPYRWVELGPASPPGVAGEGRE